MPNNINPNEDTVSLKAYCNSVVKDNTISTNGLFLMSQGVKLR